MKKQLLLSVIAIATFAGMAKGMQEPLLVGKTFNSSFYVDCHDLSQDRREELCKQLDKLLNLERPKRDKSLYSVYDILIGVLGVENLNPKQIGDNTNHTTLTIMLKGTYVDEEGNLDFYDAAHILHEHSSILKPLISGEPQKPNFKTPAPIGNQTSGPSLSWLLPTITYGGLFFGGMAVLKAYQWYKGTK